MKLYYYVHTGHNIGLDRFRRAVAIIELLGDVDITLLTSDFRIASASREYGIKRALGVDVVHNIHNIAERGSSIIFDSDQINSTIHDEMVEYFDTFIRISDDKEIAKHPKEYLVSAVLKGEGICNANPIALRYTQNATKEKDIPITIFYSDDDYYKMLHKDIENYEDLGASLLLGFYNFIDYEDEIAQYFSDVYENEDYDEILCRTKLLITTSARASLEVLECGGRAIYIQREDKDSDLNPILSECGIDIIKQGDKKTLVNTINQISSKKYHKPTQNREKLLDFLKKSLNL